MLQTYIIDRDKQVSDPMVQESDDDARTGRLLLRARPPWNHEPEGRSDEWIWMGEFKEKKRRGRRVRDKRETLVAMRGRVQVCGASDGYYYGNKDARVPDRSGVERERER